MRASFVVTVDLPDDVEIEEMAQYIEDSVASWKGSLNPDEDPLFNLDGKSVEVEALPEPLEPEDDFTRTEQ